MKTTMNFTTCTDDLTRYENSAELKAFYRSYGCAGIELMPYEEQLPELIEPDMIVGLHMNCLSDWIDIPQEKLIAHYRPNLELARRTGAEYVVFHVTQVSDEECFTYQMRHSDEEVIRAADRLINELLDGQDYSFYFLMENLWWPGLNFLNPQIAPMLLEMVHYEKKGFMLDTGHFLHTNTDLRTQKEAILYLHSMLDQHEDMIPYMKGIHLQQSLSGSYVKEWLEKPEKISDDPDERSCQLFEHLFRIDRHFPFTEPKVRELVQRIGPEYITYEYITHNNREHAEYLRAGRDALMK